MMSFVVKFLALDRTPRLLDTSLIDSVEKQNRLLENTISLKETFGHPLPPKHITSLLEAIVRTCESENLEVSELVYEELMNTLKTKAQNNDDVRYHGFYKVCNQMVVFQVYGEVGTFVQNGSTGFVTWEAGKCLAWSLCNEQHLKEGDRVLELGCGTGVTGIIVSKCCHVELSQYCLSDYHASTLVQAENNCRLNNVLDDRDKDTDTAAHTTENTHTQGRTPMLFQQIDMLAENQKEVATDVIVGADILYDESLCVGLVNFLSNDIVKFREALIMSTLRNEDTYSEFRTALQNVDSKLQWEVVRNAKMSEWIGLAEGAEWRDFLDSSSRLFDPQIELVRIRKKTV